MARYHTLIASLPHLPYFEQAERLPINRQRLERRLAMLDAADRETVRQAESFLAWQAQPAGRSDEGFVADYRRLRATIANPVLADMLDHRLAIRTVVGALRRRAAGRPAPERGTAWGIGPWLRRIEQRWQQPDFGLAAVLPWLPEARSRLERRDYAGLERLLMDLVWRHLQGIEEAHRFGFPAVLAYRFKWDMVRRRLDYDGDKAAARLDALTDEALGDNRQLFS
ncbi:MAG: hypothetical protein GVY13_01345 [Alphaproteobacteria bacterium]|nr:hypothetical protein [Alphaproteobacteria bacterium]